MVGRISVLNNPLYHAGLKMRVENRHTVPDNGQNKVRLEVPRLSATHSNAAMRAQIDYYIFITRGILKRDLSLKSS